MGNTLTAPSFVSTQQDLPTLLIEAIPAYVHHSVLGGGKIFRTVQCLHEDGLTVVKIYIRRDGADGGGQLKRFEARLDELAARTPLSACPSVLNLVKLEITDRAVFLGRQYFGSNLVDRFHVHPSLHLIEQQWFTYQMLQSLVQLHSRGIRHGDIKTENFLLTSWNWIFLVDVAFYKPTFLPSDNPADFSFYFEGQSHIRASNGMITQQARRRCYVAPERFYNQITDRKFGGAPAGPTGVDATAAARTSDAGQPNPTPSPQPSAAHLRGGGGGGSDGQVTEAMDVFSLGCVIAELFMNGESVLFDLPALLAYREGSYDPSPTIAKIPYPLVRQLIHHMIQRDPAKRFTAKQYLKIWAEGGDMGLATQEDGSSHSKPSSVDPLLSPSLGPSSSPSPSAALIGSALFPPYFPYLYKFFAKLLTPDIADPDIKIAALKTHAKTLVQEVLGRAYWEQMIARAEAADAATAAPSSSASAPDETELPPSKSPASSSTPLPAFAAAPAKGAKLLDEFASFSRALERDTQGLRTLEQIRAESDSTRANARNASAAATAHDLAQPTSLRSFSSGAPQPSPSPVLNPSSAPSTAVASLLDLASAARGTPPEGSAPLAADRHLLGGFSLDSAPGSSPSTAVAPSLPYHGCGLTMITSLVCSCIQNVRYPITKLTALELLAEFGQYVDDEVRLGRLVPYAVALLADPSSMVRATSCAILTRLLSQTQNIHSASDAHLFAEYILPALSRFTHDTEETVRLAYAQNIAELAASSKRFLDLAQTQRQVAARQAAINAEAAAAAGAAAVSTINSPTSPMSSPISSPSAAAAATAAAAAAASASGAAPLAPFDATYQQELSLLQDTVLKLIIDMLTIGGSRVKRALLGDITRLCIFMGRARVNNDLLPHLITVLNDRDWQLRSAFFEYIVGISVFVGKIAFNNFVLPCIEQSLTDTEEFVTQRAVHALTALSTLGLFEKRTVVEIAHKVAPLLIHPSAWIRHETIKLVASMAAALGPAKSHVFLVPVFRPFLRETPVAAGGSAAARIVSLTQESLVQNLKPHLTREEFKAAVQAKADEAAEAANASQQAPAPTAAATSASVAAKPSAKDSSAANSSAKARLADIPEPEAISSSLSLSSSSSEGGTNGSSGSSTLDASASSSGVRKAAGSSGFADDPALFAVMNAYLGRVSQAVRRQAGGAQSPSASSSQSGLLGQPAHASLEHLPAAGAASLLLRGAGISSDDASSSSLDDDSFLLELQNLTLSTTLEEQIPLHQLDIERTMPEVLVVGPNGRDGSGYNPTQDAFEAGGGGGGGAGGSAGSQQQSGSGGRLADPSLIPSQSARVVSGAASGANTAGATAQGGHPVPIRESMAMTPSYVVKALGVPLPPPQLGALRHDWISYSSFYQNHPVLDAASYAYSDSQDPRAWRPKGVLVASLSEHKSAVMCLAVARDNLFLASGGDEGIVKIWDAGRLKLTAHARSQLSYAQHGRITSLIVCDSSHSVASASSNGSVHVFKVEYASAQNDAGGPDGSSGGPVGAPSSQRYLGLSEVRRVDPDPVSGEGSCLAVAHFNTLSESLLVYATQKAVHGWDLRSKKDVFELRLEPSMGVLTSLSLGPTPYALVTATARGFISVWDLRFQIPVQVWRHSAKTAITSLTSVDAPSILPREVGPNGQPAGWMHPVTGPLVFAAAEGTNQISGFDLYTGENRMLFRVLNSLEQSGGGGGGGSGGAAGSGSAAPAPAGSHARKESLALGAGATLNSSAGKFRQKVQVSPLSLPSLRSYIREGGAAERGAAAKSTNAAATAYSACSGFYQSLLGNTLDESFLREFSRVGSPESLVTAASAGATSSSSAASAPASIKSFLMCKESFVLTAGTDKLVRYWDMREPADSYRIAGADLSPNDYLRYNSRFENTTVVMEEVLSNQAGPAATAGSGSGSGSNAGSSGASSNDNSSASPALKAKFVMARKTSGQTPPSTAHTSEILDMKALEFPQKMIATAARDGVIKIWI